MARIRFLQTSDVHLGGDLAERGRALSLAFEVARNRSADAILIAGDLFDRTANTEARDLVRRLVESVAPRPVVFLPGNHDAGAYGPGTDLGANAIVLTGVPRAQTTVCGLDIVGVPYQQGRTVAECLAGRTGDPRRTILMAHATVVDRDPTSFAGEGEDGSFMPIFLNDAHKHACYTALGHLHCGRHLVHRDGERLVAYAGSPVATSPREVGRRSALLVDFEPSVGVQAHEVLPLATPFYEVVEVACRPGAEDEAIEALAQKAVRHKQPGARVIARLRGVSVVSEAALRDAATRALDRAFGGAGAPLPNTLASNPSAPDASLPLLELETVSYPALADLPVIGEFVERLEAGARDDGIDDPAVLDAALRIGLEAFLGSLP